MFTFLKKLFGIKDDSTAANDGRPAVESDTIIAQVQGDVGSDAHDSIVGESHQPVSMDPNATENESDSSSDIKY